MPNTSYKYERNNKYMIPFIRNIFLALGVWPFFNNEKSTCKKIYKFLLIFLSHTLLFCALMPGILKWAIEKRIRVRIKMTSLVLYGIMCVSKYFNLIIRQDQIRRCFKHIQEDWDNIVDADMRNLMLESVKMSRRLITIAGTFAYATAFWSRVIVPLSKRKIVNEHNITIRSLPYPTYLFSIDTQASPTYEILFTIHFLCGLITISLAVCSLGLVIILVLHACGQLNILRNLINGIVKEQLEPQVKKKLANIVDHQTRLRSFVQLIEQTVGQICFIHIMGITLITCVSCYCVLMELEHKDATSFLYFSITFSTAIINLFIYTYTGEQLIIQAEKVALTSCKLEWYRLPDKTARELVLVMIMSNMPNKITAGKMFDLSVRTFGNILKTSGAYLNFLRTLTE